jgi:hypothetical protein
MVKFIAEPFRGSSAVLNIYACFGQEVSTQNDIIFTSLWLKYKGLLLVNIAAFVKLRQSEVTHD